ncbi:MAG: hydantoinase B/oxoprolinase family protein [Alphaproteobacteria bacterium]|nr:hydantoinase B/oxoprolinase family protein [Alphaproteobacteria bacterium]
MAKRDVILAQMVGGSLDSIAREMSAAVTRTARSPIFNEAHDFTTAMFDLVGLKARLVAQAPGCTVHLYGIISAVEAAVEAFKYDLHPGDVILASDPYDGGTHIPDQVILTPVFHDRKPVLIPAVRAHMGDVGGPVAGGYNPRARDTWQDGMVVPPLKIYERGEKRRDVFDMVIANNRLAHWIEGDFDAMVGACRLAAARCQALLERYGAGTVREAVAANLDYTERRVRAEIASWRPGRFSAITHVDHDYQGGHDIPIRCTAIVEGSSLTLDFTGSALQVTGFVNSPLANTLSFVFIAITSCCEEDIPINEGYIRPLRVIAPEGTIVNPLPPAPVGNCTCIPGAEIAEVALLALAQSAPKRVGVNCHKLPLAYTDGRYPDGRPWVNLNFFGYTGGAGAAYGTDGWGLYPPLMTGVILPSIEMNELQYPTRIRKHEYIADYTGPGRWRGAPGLDTEIQHLTESRTNVMMAGVRNPSRGYCGAGDGAVNRVVMRAGADVAHEVPETEFHMTLPPGGIIHTWRGGGGGWGDPLDRPAGEVLADVEDEYVTPAGALCDYGVVLAADGRSVDTAATDAERARRRAGSGAARS